MVDDLLDRLEAGSTSPARLFAYVDAFSSVTEEEAFLAELELLERDGAVGVKRRRVDGVEEIHYIRLNDAAALYRYRERRPAGLSADESLRHLLEREDLPAAVQDVLQEVRAAWARNVGWSGIRPGEVTSLFEAISLAIALAARGDGAAVPTIDYRTFSRRIAGDSKSLERQRGLVVRLLARMRPDLVSESELSDAEVLAELGVVKFPQPFLVGGPVSIDGNRLPQLPFVGLPAEQGARVSLGQVDYMLIVENYVSFVRQCREANGDGTGLIVYSGGFPAWATLEVICDLAQKARCPVFHWGDLDPGGIRIFRHLELALRDRGVMLRPHFMDMELLQRRGRPAERRSEALKVGMATDSAVSTLWDELAGTDDPLELEQEEIDPAVPDWKAVRTAANQEADASALGGHLSMRT